MTSESHTMFESPAICPLDCADTCSLKISVSDNKVEKVRGSDDNPFTQGKICAKVVSGLPEQIHGKDRLLKPMKRVGPKGPGSHFEAITWSAALDIVHTQFKQQIEQFGPQSIVPMSYGGPMGLLAGGSMDKRFFNQLGARQINSTPLCAGVSDAAYGSLFGESTGIKHEELGASKLIVIWGNNISTCNLHLTKVIRKAQKGGAKLVVIDPKKTRIAKGADLHLDLRPGTDVVLGYALAAEIQRQGGLDKPFLEMHVNGWEAYLKEANKYSLEMAAEVCELPLETIRQFAQYWCDIKPAGMNIGVGPERNRNGGSGIRTALALPVLTGNFGGEGAGVCNVSGFFPLNSDVLSREDLRQEDSEELSILDIPDRILDSSADVGETPIKSLFIYNHNPVAVHPMQDRMQQALSYEDLFIVGCDITMTDSMAYADILLPASSHLEYGDIYESYGHSFLQKSHPVLDSVGESLPNTEIFRQLAQRFGFDDPLFSESDESMMAQVIDLEHEAMQGRKLSELTSHTPIDCSIDTKGNAKPSLLRGQLPLTPSGKIELFSYELERQNGLGLPQWHPPSKNYDFILVSPSSEKRTNSTFGNVTGHNTDVVLGMNPADAEQRKLTSGQAVRVYNAQGELVLPLELNEDIKRGTVYTPKGAWLNSAPHTINVLVPAHKADIAGGACYNDTQVNVAIYEQ